MNFPNILQDDISFENLKSSQNKWCPPLVISIINLFWPKYKLIKIGQRLKLKNLHENNSHSNIFCFKFCSPPYFTCKSTIFVLDFWSKLFWSFLIIWPDSIFKWFLFVPPTIVVNGTFGSCCSHQPSLTQIQWSLTFLYSELDSETFSYLTQKKQNERTTEIIRPQRNSRNVGICFQRDNKSYLTSDSFKRLRTRISIWNMLRCNLGTFHWNFLNQS